MFSAFSPSALSSVPTHQPQQNPDPRISLRPEVALAFVPAYPCRCFGEGPLSSLTPRAGRQRCLHGGSHSKQENVAGKYTVKKKPNFFHLENWPKFSVWPCWAKGWPVLKMLPG